MWPDRVSNPEPQALESDALPTMLRSPALGYHLNFTNMCDYDSCSIMTSNLHTIVAPYCLRNSKHASGGNRHFC